MVQKEAMAAFEVLVALLPPVETRLGAFSIFPWVVDALDGLTSVPFLGVTSPFCSSFIGMV